MPTNNVTINYNEAEAAFRAQRMPGLVDVIFQMSPTVQMFMGTAIKGMREFKADFAALSEGASKFSNQFKEIGGHLWQEFPVGVLPLANSVQGTGVQAIDNTPIDTTVVAREQLTFDYQPIGLAEHKWRAIQATGGGKGELMTKLLNLQENKFETAMKTTIERIAGDIFGTGTDAETGFLSLTAGIGASATDTTTYYNISRSSYTVWRGNYNQSTGTAIGTVGNAAFVWKRMGLMVNTVVQNGARVEDLVFIAGSTVVAAHHDALIGNNSSGTGARFNPGDGKGIPGWTGLSYSAVPIIQDPFCTATSLYLVDTRTTKFTGLRGSVFDMTPWVMAEQSTLYYSRLVTAGQLCVSHPNRNYLNEWTG